MSDHTPIIEATFVQRCQEAIRTALVDVSRARALSERLIAEAGDDAFARGWATVALSNARAYAGEFSESIGLLEAALETCPVELQSMLRHALVQPLLRSGRTADAADAAAKAVEAAEVLGDALSLAKTLISQGAVLRMLGETVNAERSLRRAVAMSPPGSAVEASALSNLGECVLDLGRFAEAMECFGSAAEHFEALGMSHASAIALGNRADVLGRLGRVDEAVTAFDTARQSFERVGATLDAARLLCEEAEMLAQAGAFRAARDRYMLALPALEAQNAGGDLARACVALAGVLIELGDADSAREYLVRSEQAIDRGLTGTALAEVMVLRGSASLLSERFEDAISWGRAALESTEDWAQRCRAMLLLARTCLAVGDAASSRRWAGEALGLAESSGLDSVVPLCRSALIRSGAWEGVPGEDLRQSAKAFEEVEQVLEMTVSVAARAGLARRLRAVLDEHTSRVLEAAAEDAGAWILRSAEAASDVHAWMGEEGETDAVAELEEVSQRLARAELASGAFGRSSQTQTGLQAARSVLQARLTPRMKTKREHALSSPARVREHLPSGSMLMHWFADGDRLSALVVTARETRIERSVTSGQELGRALRRLNLLLQRPLESPQDVQAWQTLMGNLGAEVLRPALACADERPARLFVSGDPAATHLPWNGIVERTWPAAPPTVVVLGKQPTCGTSTRGRPACAAVLGADDPSLPAAREECQRVAACWPASQVRIGGSAQEWLSSLERCGLVHIATHGVFEADRPGASRLWIGDRWMSIVELAQRFVPGATVVLSACHAGRFGGFAEDVSAVPSFLLQRGVGCVIAPIWTLRDESCPDAFGELHRAMARPGTDAPDALRTAASVVGALGWSRRDFAGVVAFGGVA